MDNIKDFSHIISIAAQRNIKELEFPESLIVNPGINNKYLYQGVLQNLIIQAKWFGIELKTEDVFLKELVSETKVT